MLDKLFTWMSWDPVEDIKENNQKLVSELDEGTITVVVKGTPEQIAEVQKLSNKRVPGKPYSPRGKYLIEHFGEQIAEECRKQEENDAGKLR